MKSERTLYLISCLAFAINPLNAQTTHYQSDFESETVGMVPNGWVLDDPNGGNSATNGAIIIDSSSKEVTNIEGKSLYIYDLAGDFTTTGESTYLKQDFASSINISAAHVSFDFMRAYSDSDTDVRMHVAVARAGDRLNNSDFRPFEIRLQNDGSLMINHNPTQAEGDVDSTVNAGNFGDGVHRLDIFLNSHDSETLNYDQDSLSGTLAPNTFAVYLDGNVTGTYYFLQTPDPANAPQVNFWDNDKDLGQIGIYQDTKRQGGFVFDNLSIVELPIGGGGEVSNEPIVYIDNLDFESANVGEQPEFGFATTFSPSSNSAGNGFKIVDETSNPANPMPTGKALYAYDLDGNGSSGQSSHARFDFAPENTDNVRVDFDFQRTFSVDQLEEETRIHVAVAPAGTETNNSDFRPFEIRLQNNGTVVVNYNPTAALEDGRESVIAATYLPTGANHLTFFANGNNENALPYSDLELGDGSVPPNTMILFLNGDKLGEYGFINTPDPVGAPQIAFFETNKELGRFGIYQDSKRQGAIVIDNLSIQEFAKIPAPSDPTNLVVSSKGSTEVNLSWTDNSDSETGFLVQQKVGGFWGTIATVDADLNQYTVTELEPNTEYSFRVIATNGSLSAPSNELTVTTDVQLVPEIAMEPTDEKILSGTSIDLTVEANGAAPLSYQWYEGQTGDISNPIAGASDAIFNTGNLTTSTSFWVRVQNSNGIDDSRTAMVEVFQPRTIRIVSLAQLNALMPDAIPGDTYVLDEGVYVNAGIVFEGQGTENAPITLKARVPGQTVLIGNSYLEIGGEWMVVEGLIFRDGWNQSRDQVISFRAGGSRVANHSRVTNCAIVDYSPSDRTIDRDWIGMYGTDNRFDHNYISGHSTIGVTLVVVRTNGKEDRHLIDHNHFAHRANGGGENGWETIRIGTSGDSMSDSKSIVEYNLFEECDGEIEIISNKSGANIYRYNTFLRSKGMLTLRHGNHCLVEGNVFLGKNVSSTGGIRIIGENHVVKNNYIQGTTGRDNAAITVYAGVPNSPLNEYFAANGAVVENNTIIDVVGPHILVGAGNGSSNRSVLPTGVKIANNLFASVNRTTGSAITGDAASMATYSGNIVSEVELGSATSGFQAATVSFIEGEGGLLRPQAGSAVVDASVGSSVQLDIDGQPRDASPDVGADEITTASGINEGGALTAGDTGPYWLSPSRFIPQIVPDGFFDGATDLGEGHLSYDWWGELSMLSYPWILHQDLGWLFAGISPSENTFILYYPGIGWAYFSQTYYPWIYDYANSRWLLYYRGSTNPRYFYDSKAMLWFAL